MKKQLSRSALRFLAWVRDNEHHIGYYHPQNAGPEQSILFSLSNGRRRICVMKETVKEAFPFMKPSNKRFRMFDVSRAGLNRLKAAGL